MFIAGKIPHNHRFAGVTSEAIPYKRSHVHAILVSTDFFFNHYHEIGLRTGPAIDVGNGKHIHVAEGETTENFGHDHDFIFTTSIEKPTSERSQIIVIIQSIHQKLKRLLHLHHKKRHAFIIGMPSLFSWLLYINLLFCRCFPYSLFFPPL